MRSGLLSSHLAPAPPFPLHCKDQYAAAAYAGQSDWTLVHVDKQAMQQRRQLEATDLGPLVAGNALGRLEPGTVQ